MEKMAGAGESVWAPKDYVDLEFVITVPRHADLGAISEIKKIAKMCLGSIKEWKLLYPEIHANPKLKLRERNMKINCVTSVQRKPSEPLHDVYRSRIKVWLKKLLLYSPTMQRPLLTTNKNSFSDVRFLCHVGILTNSIAFGTLTSNTEFYAHHNEEHSPERTQIVSNFFHDTKSLEVCINNFVVLIEYSNIKHVVYDEGEVNGFLYLYLINPSKHYEIREKFRIRTVSVSGVPPDLVGRSNTVRLSVPKSVTIHDILSRLYIRCGSIQVIFTSVSVYVARYTSQSLHIDLKYFKCTYMFISLLLRGFSIELQNPGYKIDVLAQRLTVLADEEPDILYLALIDTMYMMEDGVFFNFREAVEDFYKWYKFQKESAEYKNVAHYVDPPNSSYVWRVTITPTRTLLWPASVTFDNRILRKFDAEYACRVSFRDDDNRKLKSGQEQNDDLVYYITVYKPMSEGIQIGSRLFQFLGWSNSQIREHGVWMYARDSIGNTAQTVRDWMGDFSNIKSVPLLMARMGQCFTQSELSIPLDGKCIRTEPDILGGMHPNSSKPYNFSDGIGRISEPRMRQISSVMKYENMPSALQIRHAGYKGMLVLDPSLSSDEDIIFRESMKKFVCTESCSLEIVKMSSPVPVFTNRNLITILSQLGVPSDAFLGLQKDIMKNLVDILLNSVPAVIYLNKNCQFIEINYKELSEAGISPISEPFFRSMLISLHRRDVEQIKKKARLEVPYSYGRNMFGVLDETRTLEYGQVFVQYSTEANDQFWGKEILTGPVLVTKNPCIQEGDIRVLQAVDVPELHHITDCVVFPQKGKRPHPNEMAGSDLDGDEYTVIWYKPFFPKRNAEPSDFHCPSELCSNSTCEVEDMISFLCHYVRNDQIGLIGNAYLAKADELGIDNDVCRAIAKKFTVAVDFAKRGQLVTLDKEERPTRYPDFMGKEQHSETYRSRSVLGKMFRMCQSFQIDDSTLCYRQIQVDGYLVVPGWEKYKKQALASRDRYNLLLETLLTTYGIDHEAEAMTLALLSIHMRLQERQDKVEVEEIIRKSIISLWTNTRKEFFEEFRGIDNIPTNDIVQCIMQKASAWYIVTYSDKAAMFLSFPWIVSRQLALIKIKKLEHSYSFSSPLPVVVDKLNTLFAITISYNKLPQLDLSVSCLVLSVCPNHDWFSLELATRVLLHWARHHQLIRCPAKQTRLEASRLLTFFLNVVKRMHLQSSAIEMLLSFFQRCISWCFTETESMCHFFVAQSKLKLLGKISFLTYHSLVFSSNFGILGLRNGSLHDKSEDQEMDPVRLSWKLVSRYRKTDFQLLKHSLASLSGVTEVSIRELENCGAILSASGSPYAIKKLKSVVFNIHCLRL